MSALPKTEWTFPGEEEVHSLSTEALTEHLLMAVANGLDDRYPQIEAELKRRRDATPR
jgi:hypothetical protein